MASGKQTPRQKMINMMYLVLTALLALNISKEIILAFVLINTGIEKTTDNFQSKNNITYAGLSKAKMLDPAKATGFYNKGQAVKKLANDIYVYIEELKKDLMVKCDKLDPGTPQADTITLESLEKKDENNIPTEIMLGAKDDASDGKARELKLKLIDFKKNVKALLSGIKDGERVKIDINTDDPPPSIEHGSQSWELANFGHMPVAPVIVMLTKLQADIRNVEGDVINHLLTQISADDFKFDTLAAKVIAKSNYVLLGSDYEADIIVAAYSTTQNPSIWLGELDTVTNKIKGAIDSSSVVVQKGVGKYILSPTSEGEQKWGGVVRIITPSGQRKSFPFHTSFIAAKPSMVVSADKMNVLYIGVDNPVSVSVPGVPAEKVNASLSQGSLSKKGKGKFIAKVRTPGKATISVRAEINGEMQSMGKPVEFRVKRVPDPVAFVANKKGGVVTKNILAAQGGVIPVLENFDFDLVFRVLSFDMTVAGKGRDIMTAKSSSNVITPEMRELINRTRLNDKVYFENIKAIGPDGTTRNLSSISFTMN